MLLSFFDCLGMLTLPCFLHDSMLGSWLSQLEFQGSGRGARQLCLARCFKLGSFGDLDDMLDMLLDQVDSFELRILDTLSAHNFLCCW